MALGDHDLDLCGVWGKGDTDVPQSHRRGAVPAVKHTGSFFDDDENVPEFVQFWERPSERTACRPAPSGPAVKDAAVPERSFSQMACAAKEKRMNIFDSMTQRAGFTKHVHFNGDARERIGRDVTRMANSEEQDDPMCARVSDFVTSQLHEQDGLGLYRDQRPAIGWCREGYNTLEPTDFKMAPMAPLADELYRSVTVQSQGEGVNNDSLL